MSALYSSLRNSPAHNEGSNLNSGYNTEMSASTLLLNSSASKNSKIDDHNDRDVISKPHSGIDDGFAEKNKYNGHGNNLDMETVLEDTKPSGSDINGTAINDPQPTFIPDITSRLGPDDGNNLKADDGKDDESHRSRSLVPHRPGFTYTPSHDFEIGSIPGELESIPDVNIYQHKKTLAQGMMDLALFSANANQLRYVLESYARHPYYYPSIIFISFSLILQVAIGIGLVWNATYNVKDEKEICVANKINNFTVIGIFLVTVVNVFISAFGVANPP